MKFSHLCVVYQLRKEKKNSLHRPGSVRLFDFYQSTGAPAYWKTRTHQHNNNYILKVHRFLKETLGATHNNLKCLQRTEYYYVSQASWKCQDLAKALISWNKVSIILHITRTSSTVFLHPHLACAAT